MRARIADFLGAERPRFLLWSPLALMIGIGWYFHLLDEPPPFFGLRLLSGCALLAFLTWRRPLRWLVLPLFLIALGFAAAQFRAQQMAALLLTHEVRNQLVEGTIDEIEPVEKKEKLILSHLAIEDVPEHNTPRRVRVSFRGQNDLNVGDRIRFTANLYPLPSPIMPGGYDFARHFYFRGIGGNGYALYGPEVISGAEQGVGARINNLRHRIGEDMRTHMAGATGAVAAAMTVGETGPIPEDTKNTLRDSGLAHMLSISGLHLAIAAGFVFFNIRLLLTLYPPLALRISAKKIAAVFALLGAGAYLLLAGSPVPAQRAFIMVAFLFLAMLFDRRGITLRTLAIAAFFILLAFPEAMFGPSFQMSFAATLAIVSLYEGFGRQLYNPNATLGRRVWHHVLGIAVTSLAATLATCPFILYHFNRFAIFGLISNMLVIPLATFIIMPGVVIALLLMPFGLQGVGYLLLGWGTDIMIDVSAWVTALPYSSLHLPSPTDAGLAMAALGIIWLCLIQSRVRLLGPFLIAGGLSTTAAHEPVDVLVSDDGKQVMARLSGGEYTMLKGTGRAFVAQNWLRTEGQKEFVPVKKTNIVCDKTTCSYQRNGYWLIVVRKPDNEAALIAACATKAELLIAWAYMLPESCPGPVQFIGRSELENFGAHAIWLDKDAIRIQRTHDKGSHRRIWQPALWQDPEEDD